MCDMLESNRYLGNSLGSSDAGMFEEMKVQILYSPASPYDPDIHGTLAHATTQFVS